MSELDEKRKKEIKGIIDKFDSASSKDKEEMKNILSKLSNGDLKKTLDKLKEIADKKRKTIDKI